MGILSRCQRGGIFQQFCTFGHFQTCHRTYPVAQESPDYIVNVIGSITRPFGSFFDQMGECMDPPNRNLNPDTWKFVFILGLLGAVFNLPNGRQDRRDLCFFLVSSLFRISCSHFFCFYSRRNCIGVTIARFSVCDLLWCVKFPCVVSSVSFRLWPVWISSLSCISECPLLYSNLHFLS